MFVIRSSKELCNRLGRKPILTDTARWYNEACKWLRLPHQVYGTKLKNLIERFIQHIKDWTECFDDHFTCRKKNCNRQHVWNWLKLFVLYFHACTDRIRFMMFFSLWMVVKLTEPRGYGRNKEYRWYYNSN